jgi:hypothetical protein
MEKTQPANPPQTAVWQAFRQAPARFTRNEPAGPSRPYRRLDNGDGLASGSPAASMITPVAAAIVIACTLSPAISFVLLRSKGYSLLTASVGVAAGALGLLIAIVAPSRRPVN